MSDFDLERLLAERPLAVERSQLAAIEAQAGARIVGDLKGLRRKFAAIGGGGMQPHRIQRMGAVALIPISGLIVADDFLVWLLNGTHPDVLMNTVQSATVDPEIKALALVIDSPGGLVSLITETAAEIRRARTYKPVVSIVRCFAASAAYWLASQADEVIVTPSGEVGSVGVYCTHYDLTAANEMSGVKPTYIAAGKYKTEANPDEPLADDARAFIQKRVNELHQQFLTDIAIGREIPLATVRSRFDGRMYGPAEAVQRGLADSIGTLDATVARLLKPAAGIMGTRRAARIEHSHRQLAAALDECELVSSPSHGGPSSDRAQADRDELARALAEGESLA